MCALCDSCYTSGAGLRSIFPDHSEIWPLTLCVCVEVHHDFLHQFVRTPQSWAVDAQLAATSDIVHVHRRPSFVCGKYWRTASTNPSQPSHLFYLLRSTAGVWPCRNAGRARRNLQSIAARRGSHPGCPLSDCDQNFVTGIVFFFSPQRVSFFRLFTAEASGSDDI